MWIQAGAGISRWQPEDTFLLSNTSRPNLGPPTLLFSDDRELLPRGLSSPAAMVIIHLHLVPKLRVELYLHYPCVPSWHVHGQLYLYLYLYWAQVLVNLLAPELFFLILAHPVYKMWIIQEPNKLALGNKLHFEEEKTESIEHVSNIQYLHLLNKYIKCNVWRLAVWYDLYIGR